MNYTPRIVALVSGIAMIPALAALVYVFPFIEIRTGRLELDEAIGKAGLALFSLAWSWITLRWLARPTRVTVWWCLGGLIVSLPCLPFIDAVLSHYSCLDYARQNLRGIWDCSFQPNLYYRFSFEELPPLLAVFSGFALAAASVLRSERSAVRGAYA
jgi:hypothetical protein